MSRLGRSPYASLSWPSTLRMTLAVILVLSAVAFSLSSLQTLIQPGSWLATGVAFVAILAIVTLTIRLTVIKFMARVTLFGTLLPSLLGTVTGAWLILARFGGEDGGFSPLPTVSHATRVWDQILEARELTVLHIAPIEAFDPIVLIACVGACLVFVLADLLANGIRMPGLTVLTMLPLWLPQLMLVPDTRYQEILGVGGSLLLLLAVDNPYRTSPRFPDPTTRFLDSPARRSGLLLPRFLNSLGAIAVVVLGALGLSLVAPSLPVWELGNAPSLRNAGNQVRLSDTLDVRNSLGPRANNVVFRYRTDQPPDEIESIGPLRSATLTDFDGEVWTPPSTANGSVVNPGTLLFPTTELEVLDPFRVTMTIADLRDTALPIPVEPRALREIQGASYDPIHDVLELGSATQDGDQIIIDTSARALTQDLLRGPQAGSPLTFPADYGRLALEPALRLPDSPHLSDVIAFAGTLTEGAPTNYDKALILQNYLRDTNNFKYSLDLPERRTEDSVWDFLTDRTGYCIQFASAMTIMARTQGMPARMAVGFLPGQPNDSDEFVVRGRNAHAWTEIFFENVGWVRFEPTPSQQAGSSPQWAPSPTSSAEIPPTPTQAVPTTTSKPTASKPSGTLAPTTSGAPAAAANTGWAGSSLGLPLVLVLVTVLLLAIVGRILLTRRRALAQRGVEGGWDKLLVAAADAGFTIEGASTVRQIADLLEPAPPGMADRPIHELAHLVELGRYAPRELELGAEDVPPGSGIEVLVNEALESLARTVKDRADAARN